MKYLAVESGFSFVSDHWCRLQLSTRWWQDPVKGGARILKEKKENPTEQPVEDTSRRI